MSFWQKSLDKLELIPFVKFIYQIKLINYTVSVGKLVRIYLLANISIKYGIKNLMIKSNLLIIRYLLLAKQDILAY